MVGCWEVQSYSWTREGPSLGAGVPMGLIRNSSLPASAFQSKTLDAMGVTAYFHVDRNVVLSGIVGSLRRAGTRSSRLRQSADELALGWARSSC